MVAEDFYKTDTLIKVGDSRPGWAKSLKELIAMLYAGQIPSWDVSEVRPEGFLLMQIKNLWQTKTESLYALRIQM